jgi:protein-S-isoprenylcysteine O-methyltransferase Ste14
LVLPSSSGSGGELLAIPLVLASESIKARREEQSVAAEFGNDYEEYRRQTGFLIPGG